MTLGFPTVLISSLQKHDDDHENDGLSLNKEQISWISSLNLICVPLGCIFSGSFATLIGRRRAMQLVNVPIFISWIIFFYSQHVYQLYIALAISGFTGKCYISLDHYSCLNPFLDIFSENSLFLLIHRWNA